MTISAAATEHPQPALVTVHGDGRGLTPEEAAAYLGLSASTLAKKRVTGINSPAYIQAVPNGAVRYRICDLDEWSQAHLLRSTSDPRVR